MIELGLVFEVLPYFFEHLVELEPLYVHYLHYGEFRDILQRNEVFHCTRLIYI